MQIFNFNMFKAKIQPVLPQLKLHIDVHFTKSPKRDNIYKLCSWMVEQHTSNCLIFTKHIAQNYKPILHCT